TFAARQRDAGWFTAPRISLAMGYTQVREVPEVGRRGRNAPHAHRLLGHRRSVDRLPSRRIFNTAGDSLVADFASAVEAAQCAVAVQEAISSENAGRSASEQMRFRIGIHVGDIIVNGDNLFGDAVNVAA